MRAGHEGVLMSLMNLDIAHSGIVDELKSLYNAATKPQR